MAVRVRHRGLLLQRHGFPDACILREDGSANRRGESVPRSSTDEMSHLPECGTA